MKAEIMMNFAVASWTTKLKESAEKDVRNAVFKLMAIKLV